MANRPPIMPLSVAMISSRIVFLWSYILNPFRRWFSVMRFGIAFRLSLNCHGCVDVYFFIGELTGDRSGLREQILQ